VPATLSLNPGLWRPLTAKLQRSNLRHTHKHSHLVDRVFKIIVAVAVASSNRLIHVAVLLALVRSSGGGRGVQRHHDSSVVPEFD